MSQKVINTEVEMTTLAEEVLSILPQKKTAHVIALSGDLGAGKTTFVKALAKLLGITEHITSPTFVIMKQYDVLDHYLVSKLIHIDAYRIEDIAEMEVIGLPELVEKQQTLICIEWPEKIEEILPKDILSIHIEINEDGTRTVIYDS
ncbi:tRNA (adenosine(37)-N6)-threonylcarbamoyltransferase complex ATPase subunit type 1 TsaE [bacterium]|nr:tRNA (adenosine(37)-N6)-threonylcarbamoyltransferase complex ATPase subunit type 1 TsaE [bacterium]